MTRARLPVPSWSLTTLLLSLAACGGGGAGGSSSDGGGSPSEPAAGPVSAVTFPRSGDGFTIQRDSTDPECAGLLPEGSLPAAVTRSSSLAAGQTCGPGFSDGTGNVAMGWHDTAGNWAWQVRNRTGGFVRNFTGASLSPLLTEAQGWMGLVAPPPPPDDPQQDVPLSVDLKVIGPDGHFVSSTAVNAPRKFWSDHGYWAITSNWRWDLGEDPRGGAAVAFSATEHESNPSTNLQMRRFAPDGTPRSDWAFVSGQLDLGGPEVLATAVSTLGPTLVIHNFRRDRTLDWYTAEGEQLATFTDDTFVANLPYPDRAHAQLQPLLDGSVALIEDGKFTRVYHPGSATGEAAPAWLAGEAAGAHLRFTRGNRGYAVFPPSGASATPCEQTVELRAPSGRLCGRVVVSQGASACTTAAIDQGWDGTVAVQSARDTCTSSGCTCTHRWWPALLASPGPRPPPPALAGQRGDGFGVEKLSTASACAGLVPSGTLPGMVHASVNVAPEAVCQDGVSDGTGHVALGRKLLDATTYRTDYTWSARDAAGHLAHTFDAEGLSPLITQASGWHALANDRSSLNHKVIRPDGTTARTTLVASISTPGLALDGVIGPDPRGGSVVAASVPHPTTTGYTLSVSAFAPDGTPRWSPVVLADQSGYAPFQLATAAARDGSVLVLWADSLTGIQVRWLTSAGVVGAAFTDVALSQDVPAVVTLAPLLDGSIAVRADGEWVRSYQPGATAGAPPPAWLTTHPGATPRFTRGNRGYAFFPAPLAVETPTCDTQVELVAPDGTLCGRVTFREANTGCMSGALDQGWDGTVVRQSAREDCSGGTCTCSHQWWPRLLAGP